MGEIKGYLIENEYGEFLTRDLFWYRHPEPEEAFVHPEESLGQILRESQDWTSKPMILHLATYDGRKTVIGERLEVCEVGSEEKERKYVYFVSYWVATPEKSWPGNGTLRTDHGVVNFSDIQAMEADLRNHIDRSQGLPSGALVFIHDYKLLHTVAA